MDETELRKYLQDMYWKENKTLRDISATLQTPLATVFLFFKRYKIRTRTISQARKLRTKIIRKKKRLLEKMKINNESDVIVNAIN